MDIKKFVEISESGSDEHFLKSVDRWNKVKKVVQKNLNTLSKNPSKVLEKVDRVKAFIKRKSKDTSSNEWLDEALDVLKSKNDIVPEGLEAKAILLDEVVDKASSAKLRTLTQEKLIGADETESIEFFERCLNAARPVGRICQRGESVGTGFFVGENIMMTNHHVIKSEDEARVTSIEMNVEENSVDPPRSQEEYNLDPDRFFYTNKHLDVTFVSTKNKSANRRTPASEFKGLPLSKGEGKVIIGGNINIIQHPKGGDKRVAFRNSQLVKIDNSGAQEEFLYYTADTQRGSSGSPLLSDRWKVVGIHHHSFPKMDINGNILDKKGKRLSEERAKANPDLVDWVANEGTRVSRIVDDLEGPNLSASMKSIRTELLLFWED